MTTPRTINASEVRKGMRVRWEDHYSDATVTTEGLVSSATNGPSFAHIDLGSTRQVGRSIDKDHPVTVLADPEPEWVEGAWYRVEIDRNSTIAKRVEGGWVRWDGPAYPSWEDVDRSRVVTVLGRVLIVDWPGDGVARDILEAYSDSRNDFTIPANQMAVKIADAIRAQGGVR